jgi:predicted secreted protein
MFSSRNNDGADAMKKHFIKIAILMLTGSWTTVPVGAGAKEETMAVFPMSDKEETCIQVQAGQMFALKFITSPGTGYNWELAVPPDEKMLVILETRNEASDSGLPGASEYEFWTCRALAAGQAEIKLKYVRPWEKDMEPHKKHVFKVQVQ